jgi:hypothetical protein
MEAHTFTEGSPYHRPRPPMGTAILPCPCFPIQPRGFVWKPIHLRRGLRTVDPDTPMGTSICPCPFCPYNRPIQTTILYEIPYIYGGVSVRSTQTPSWVRQYARVHFAHTTVPYKPRFCMRSHTFTEGSPYGRPRPPHGYGNMPVSILPIQPSHTNHDFV